MPAIGLLATTLASGDSGVVVITGTVSSVNTSAFSAGDLLYVGASGGLTATPPTGEANEIQNIAKVIKSDASSGVLMVTGPSRDNATPNLNNGKFFLGNGSNQSATATFSTEVTGAMAPTITSTLATAESVSLALSIALG